MDYQQFYIRWRSKCYGFETPSRWWILRPWSPHSYLQCQSSMRYYPTPYSSYHRSSSIDRLPLFLHWISPQFPYSRDLSILWGFPLEFWCLALTFSYNNYYYYNPSSIAMIIPKRTNLLYHNSYMRMPITHEQPLEHSTVHLQKDCLETTIKY